jgi:hypothetical protein
LSGNGCNAPVPGAPVAWDGFGPVPSENGGGDDKPKRRTSQKHEIVVGPLNATAAQPDIQTHAKDQWEQEQAVDQDADASLTRQLKICRGC